MNCYFWQRLNDLAYAMFIMCGLCAGGGMLIDFCHTKILHHGNCHLHEYKFADNDIIMIVKIENFVKLMIMYGRDEG